jgi:hypothetical protein
MKDPIKLVQKRRRWYVKQVNAGNQIYFIQGVKTKLIKIGYTSLKLGIRLSNMQAGSPDKLQILLILTGDRALEQQLHVKFAKYHKHGEWFRPGTELLKFIGENCKITSFSGV